MAAPRLYIIGVAALWLANLLAVGAIFAVALDPPPAAAPARLVPIATGAPRADCYHRLPNTLGERLQATSEAATIQSTYGNDCRP